jgi:hypothetical protein
MIEVKGDQGYGRAFGGVSGVRQRETVRQDAPWALDQWQP